MNKYFRIPNVTGDDKLSIADWWRVKNYNLATNQNGLIYIVSKQAIERQANLPAGMRQEVIIDIRGQTLTTQQRAVIRKSIAEKSNGSINPSSIRFKTE
ncbi:hypothetical protein [Pectobacterium punjabense]|uniref:hypothetical protein n=1 Tax=Pectobacterium punjabense TaxID=2108399 RepID=UPI003120248B